MQQRVNGKPKSSESQPYGEHLDIDIEARAPYRQEPRAYGSVVHELSKLRPISSAIKLGRRRLRTACLMH